MGNDFAAAQELLRNAKPARGKFSASGFCRALVGLVLNMVNERVEFGFHTPPWAIPVHLVSSNRVSLLSGRTATPGPCLYRLIHPGWTGQKATQLRNGGHGLSRSHGARVTTVLNPLLRYSLPVPRFDEGFFGFRDMHEVAAGIVGQALHNRLQPSDRAAEDVQTISFLHHSNTVKCETAHPPVPPAFGAPVWWGVPGRRENSGGWH
ncbi:hypothetical protein N7537_011928 [Penicillium hordei]|uniref:Uncharacterized protein n=1 Tax=Penicillium hordei TaxID=40994 RepID=A0AAD6DMR2_9EURO|nr:uncharacterized protein N7537_011928 [Penicillium hordei]KAJ5589250.1 hypothetical protein N7537_011928 [Penicillium hordei]